VLLGLGSSPPNMPPSRPPPSPGWSHLHLGVHNLSLDERHNLEDAEAAADLIGDEQQWAHAGRLAGWEEFDHLRPCTHMRGPERGGHTCAGLSPQWGHSPLQTHKQCWYCTRSPHMLAPCSLLPCTLHARPVQCSQLRLPPGADPQARMSGRCRGGML